MSELEALLRLVQSMQRAIRDEVLQACEQQSVQQLSSVADDRAGDTIYAIDKVGERIILDQLGPDAEALGGIALVAEGVEGGLLVFPEGWEEDRPRWRLIVDPIDGTRGLMYQKRSAWVLSALAPNRGRKTRLGECTFAVQTEIPTLKQHLSDELSAVRGRGARAERYNRLTGQRVPLELAPSGAPGIEHGYAMLSRFFPGARDELAAIEEEVLRELLGPPPPGKALCFEEQYASSGGQLYELMAGHDRFNADLRPLLAPVLAERGLTQGLCCHPYDVCGALIAEELGVTVTDAYGSPLNPPLDLETDVAWVAYANSQIRRQVEPALQRVLSARGLL